MRGAQVDDASPESASSSGRLSLRCCEPVATMTAFARWGVPALSVTVFTVPVRSASTIDAVAKAGEVLHLGRLHQRAAGHHRALEDQRLQRGGAVCRAAVQPAGP